MIRRMQATRILAVRHGETAWNVDGRIQGHLDIALSDVGRAQARRLGRALAEREPLALIVSSDLARAQETARIVADSKLADLATAERRRAAVEGRIERQAQRIFKGTETPVLGMRKALGTGLDR